MRAQGGDQELGEGKAVAELRIPCKGCGARLEIPKEIVNTYSALTYLKTKGWTFTDDHGWLCPDCAKRLAGGATDER